MELVRADASRGACVLNGSVLTMMASEMGQIAGELAKLHKANHEAEAKLRRAAADRVAALKRLGVSAAERASFAPFGADRLLAFDGGAAGNAFEVKVALAYLRQCSVPATVTSSYSANQVTHRFAFPPNLVL